MPVTCLRVSAYSWAEKEKGTSEMKSYLFALGLALCCVVQAEWKEVTTISNQVDQCGWSRAGLLWVDCSGDPNIVITSTESDHVC